MSINLSPTKISEYSLIEQSLSYIINSEEGSYISVDQNIWHINMSVTAIAEQCYWRN